MKKMLEKDPNKRISADEALHHPYFVIPFKNQKTSLTVASSQRVIE